MRSVNWAVWLVAPILVASGPFVALVLLADHPPSASAGTNEADEVDNGDYYEVDNGAASVAPLAVRGPTSLVGSGWHTFAWFGDGLADRTFSITTKTAVRITVTDAFCRGDTLTVSENKAVLAVTPTVPVDACKDPVEDPNVAAKDTGFGHTSFALKPGTYNLSINATTSPDTLGAGFIRITRPRLSCVMPRSDRDACGIG